MKCPYKAGFFKSGFNLWNPWPFHVPSSPLPTPYMVCIPTNNVFSFRRLFIIKSILHCPSILKLQQQNGKYWHMIPVCVNNLITISTLSQGNTEICSVCVRTYKYVLCINTIFMTYDIWICGRNVQNLTNIDVISVT